MIFLDVKLKCSPIVGPDIFHHCLNVSNRHFFCLQISTSYHRLSSWKKNHDRSPNRNFSIELYFCKAVYEASFIKSQMIELQSYIIFLLWIGPFLIALHYWMAECAKISIQCGNVSLFERFFSTKLCVCINQFVRDREKILMIISQSSPKWSVKVCMKCD